jgi:16S rRNA (guanine527-N7)-methyltransferase
MCSAAALRTPPEPMMDATAFRARTGATDDQMADLDMFRQRLAEANEHMNLVGPATVPDFWNRHAFDSWQLLDHPAGQGALRWADLGAGAGLPGVVLAIFLKTRPGGRIWLVDSLTKRCRFLSEVVEALALPAVVVNGRGEDQALTVDVVTARAVAPMDRLLAYAQPCLERGAQGLFLKGERAAEELNAARKSWRIEADLMASLSDPRGRLVHVRSARRVR